MLRQFGLGLAVAVFVDAVVIRCLVVPAVMRILGERAWWMPAWLDRALPRLRLEA
jgi:RND superfamily putative drug exporter